MFLDKQKNWPGNKSIATESATQSRCPLMQWDTSVLTGTFYAAAVRFLSPNDLPSCISSLTAKLQRLLNILLFLHDMYFFLTVL